MLKSQTLSLEASRLSTTVEEMRLAVNNLPVEDETRDTKLNELLAKQTELVSKMQERDEALTVEDAEAQAAMARNADQSGWTAEMREFHQLGQRTSMVEYMRAGLAQRQLTPGTPEHEYNTHVFGDTFNMGEYPLEMLLDRNEYFSLEAWQAAQIHEKEAEQRTEITGVVGTAGNLSFVDRILANSDGAWLRASYPAVGPGRHSYPIVSGTSAAQAIARGTAETPAGGITVANADPERIQHSYEVARADELQMPGIMGYMVGDLRMSLASGLDKKVVDDLVVALGAANLQTAGTTVTQASMFQAIATGVNGIGASTFDQVRVLANIREGNNQTSFYAKASEFIGSVGNGGAFNYLTTMVRSSHHMDSATGGLGNAILIRMGAAPPRLIVPTWRRAEIMRDTGRLQLSGAITLTGAIYADVIVAATDMHDHISVDTQ